MNRRSFLRQALGTAAGAGALVLGAKNLGSPSIGDRKELPGVRQAGDVRKEWGLDARPSSHFVSNPPYAWLQHNKVYPRYIRTEVGRDGGSVSSEIEWTDGLTTTHVGFAKLYDGEMPTEYWAIDHVLLSGDGRSWVEVNAEARLAADCTGWVWRQERYYGGNAMGWGDGWRPGEIKPPHTQAYYSEPPLDIYNTDVPGRVTYNEGQGERTVVYKL